MAFDWQSEAGEHHHWADCVHDLRGLRIKRSPRSPQLPSVCSRRRHAGGIRRKSGPTQESEEHRRSGPERVFGVWPGVAIRGQPGTERWQTWRSPPPRTAVNGICALYRTRLVSVESAPHEKMSGAATRRTGHPSGSRALARPQHFDLAMSAPFEKPYFAIGTFYCSEAPRSVRMPSPGTCRGWRGESQPSSWRDEVRPANGVGHQVLS